VRTPENDSNTHSEIEEEESTRDATTPKRVIEETDAPKPKSAVKERFQYLVVGGVALILLAVAWGFHKRMAHTTQQKEQQIQTKTASDAATSSRKTIEAATPTKPVSAVYGDPACEK
jgi:uncharacterized protein HemX